LARASFEGEIFVGRNGVGAETAGKIRRAGDGSEASAAERLNVLWPET
jgi:hypothetical protein